VNTLIKSKIALIFITFYFSFLFDMVINLFGKNILGTKVYILYGVLAIISFVIYSFIEKQDEEEKAHEFFSSMFAISLVYLPVAVFSFVYSNWLFVPIVIFLLAYPFLYLNKCCIRLSQWYKKKRETSKIFRFWRKKPYDIEDTERMFNFNNVYIGALVTTIMYLSQLYAGLSSSSIPMFFVYIFYLSYIFIYLLFMGGYIQKKTFPVVDLMIVLLISIFYVTASSYFVTNNKDQNKKSKLFIEYEIDKDKDYLRSSKIEKKMMRDNIIYFVKYTDYTSGDKNNAKQADSRETKILLSEEARVKV